MDTLLSTMRRALVRACRLARARAIAPALALFLAATVLAAPIGADAAGKLPEERDLAIRVQVILKSVTIHDDRDWGDGDFHFHWYLGCYAKGSSCFGLDSVNVDHYMQELSAGSGETVPLGVVLPRSAEYLSTNFVTSFDAGYSLYIGHSYELGFNMWEDDDLTATEEMGRRHIVLNAQNSWGVGTHTLRSTRNGEWGDFTLEFEVRPAPLPELQPISIEVRKLAGGRELACMGVTNRGVADADRFDVAFQLKGATVPGARVDVGGLAAGASRELCVNVDLPDTGQYEIGMHIDDLSAVVERSEITNYYRQLHTASQGLANAEADDAAATFPLPSPSPAPEPTPKPKPTKAPRGR